MASKTVIWKCPSGEHQGVRAPSRPRKDDIRRFCLDCSTETGRLVERVAPAVERKRARKAEARKRKAATKARRAAKKVKAARTLSPTVWPDTLHAVYRRQVGSYQFPMYDVLREHGVTLHVVKARTKASKGKCEFKAKRIVVKAGTFEAAGKLTLAYQMCRFVAHLGGRKDDASVALVLYKVAKATFRDFTVEHYNEPDLVEVQSKFLLHLSRK